jgi:Protein kinase domain.
LLETKINPSSGTDDPRFNGGPQVGENSIGSHTTGDTSPRKLFSYKKGPLIGKGSFGEVYECLNQTTGELLAVKSVKVMRIKSIIHLNRSMGIS